MLAHRPNHSPRWDEPDLPGGFPSRTGSSSSLRRHGMAGERIRKLPPYACRGSAGSFIPPCRVDSSRNRSRIRRLDRIRFLSHRDLSEVTWLLEGGSSCGPWPVLRSFRPWLATVALMEGCHLRGLAALQAGGGVAAQGAEYAASPLFRCSGAVALPHEHCRLKDRHHYETSFCFPRPASCSGG